MHDILGIFYLFYCPLFIYFGTRHVITLFIWLKVKLKSETSKENFEKRASDQNGPRWRAARQFSIGGAWRS